MLIIKSTKYFVLPAIPCDSAPREPPLHFSLASTGGVRYTFRFIKMKDDIHPDYTDTVIACACGAAYRTRSTRDNIKIGICAACHPFFTGEQKFVDTAGRVDKFKKRYGTVRAPRKAPKPTAA